MNGLVESTTIKELFVKKFGEGGQICIGRAPGRVNLIGEHTDYNDGFVFPMALDFRIMAAARLRNDSIVKIYSADYDECVEFSLKVPIKFDNDKKWSNYPRGVLFVLQSAGFELQGMEIAFEGNVPQGAGLSSSAAIEVATAIVIQNLLNLDIEPTKLVRFCQEAENKFVGMNCGIMDQFISMMGKKDRALFLDCRTLEYKHVPLELGNYRIVICKSGVKHSLVDSEYNKRRQECENGVEMLSVRYAGIKALRDANLEQLDSCRLEMDEIVYKRCKHVITENNRVLESINALTASKLERFGELMNATHDSLRDDYNVSCPEIDLIVNLAREIDGVIGSRITGGGFGGCTVNLVSADAIEEFSRYVLGTYEEKTGIKPEMYISTAANGAEILG